MAHDLVIRGGTLVDGSGVAPFPADVAVADGRVAEVGRLRDRSGGEELDATGCYVLPGVIDPHTHLDAQLCWDGTASPSSHHGVTTVLGGMCGFGVAPCPPGGGEYLLRSLEVVEEIPYESTSAGIDFTWGTFGQYLDHLASRPLAVNAGFLVPHSALRYTVMGERARGETATDEDRAALTGALREALDAGGLGFASSRGPNHQDAHGEPVVSRHADDAEIRALVAECRGRPWQMNVRTKFAGDAQGLLDEVAGYAAWTRDAGARLTWSPCFADEDGTWRRALQAAHDLDGDGIEVVPQVLAQPLALWDTSPMPEGDPVEIPVLNKDQEGLEALVDDPATLIGLGDAGAHIRSVTNYTYPTTLLAGLVRDQERIPIEHAVRRLTSHPAEFFGLRDRGRVQAGWAADLAVVDLDALELAPLEVVADLPAGAERLVRSARGWRAAVVNGVVTRRDGAATGASPGQVLRA